jgi:hypothetical protein
MKKLIAKMALATVVAAGAAAFVAPSASASTINWTLQGVAFDDGGTAFGTFSTDSTNGNVTAWNITTTAGSALSGYLYNSTNSSFYPSGGAYYIFSPTYWTTWNDVFASPLTSPGVISLALGYYAYEMDLLHVSRIRHVLSGAAIGVIASTPLPAALPLFATGLGVTWLLARRRKRMPKPAMAA